MEVAEEIDVAPGLEHRQRCTRQSAVKMDGPALIGGPKGLKNSVDSDEVVDGARQRRAGCRNDNDWASHGMGLQRSLELQQALLLLVPEVDVLAIVPRDPDAGLSPTRSFLKLSEERSPAPALERWQDVGSLATTPK